MAAVAPVTFDYDYWVAAYPEFAACSPAQGQSYFDRACAFFDNTICNPAVVVGESVFRTLFYMLTSHIAWLSAPRDANGNPSATGVPASPLVGRLNSAGEGSVNVGVEWNGSGSPSEAWFIQTKYGAEFWAATAQFRTFRYSARPTIVATGIFPGYWPFAAGRYR